MRIEIKTNAKIMPMKTRRTKLTSNWTPPTLIFQFLWRFFYLHVGFAVIDWKFKIFILREKVLTRKLHPVFQCFSQFYQVVFVIYAFLIWKFPIVARKRQFLEVHYFLTYCFFYEKKLTELNHKKFRLDLECLFWNMGRLKWSVIFKKDLI